MIKKIYAGYIYTHHQDFYDTFNRIRNAHIISDNTYSNSDDKYVLLINNTTKPNKFIEFTYNKKAILYSVRMGSVLGSSKIKEKKTNSFCEKTIQKIINKKIRNGYKICINL